MEKFHTFFGHFLQNLGAPNLVGEIGVMCNIPQPFTVRTRRLSHNLLLCTPQTMIGEICTHLLLFIIIIISKATSFLCIEESFKVQPKNSFKRGIFRRNRQAGS